MGTNTSVEIRSVGSEVDTALYMAKTYQGLMSRYVYRVVLWNLEEN